jgi:hypothetical protein
VIWRRRGRETPRTALGRIPLAAVHLVAVCGSFATDVCIENGSANGTQPCDGHFVTPLKT